MSYEREQYRRATLVSFSEPADLRADRAVFERDLEAGEEWHTCIDIVPAVGDEQHAPRLRCNSFGRVDPDRQPRTKPATSLRRAPAAPRSS